ncbi:MAG: hypothetical protein AAF530_17090 [Pseudomonadota bacterium]
MNSKIIIATVLSLFLLGCASDPDASAFDDAAGFRGDDQPCTGTWGECVEDDITSGGDPGDAFVDE